MVNEENALTEDVLREGARLMTRFAETFDERGELLDWLLDNGSALFAMAARAGRVDAIVAEHDRMCTGDNDCDLGDKVLRIYERDRAEQREDAKGGE